MFDERMVFYFETIFLTFLYIYFIWDLEEVLFVNIEKRSEFFFNIGIYIILLVMFLPGIYDIPLVVNTPYTLQRGTIITYESKGMSLAGTYKYDVMIRDEKSGKKFKYESVRAKEMKKGMQVEVCKFATKNLHSVLKKTDGKTTNFYRVEPYNRDKERIFVFSGIVIHAAVMMFLLCRDYVGQGKKKMGGIWLLIGIVSGILYLLLAWIGIQSQINYRLVGIGMGISYMICILSRGLLVWNLKKEKYLDERPFWRREDESKEKTTVDIGKKERIINKQKGTDLNQMSRMNSEKYCTYKYKKRMQLWFGKVLGLEVMYILLAVAIVFMCEGKYLGFIMTGTVVLSLVTVVFLITNFKRKNTPIKKSIGSNIEYGRIVKEAGKNIKLICSDGKVVVKKMPMDDEQKMKKGEEVVVIYFPATNQIFVERLKVWNKFFI